MATTTKSASFKVELQRSKDEILELKSQADSFETSESTIIASVIDWLFDSSADNPLDSISEDPNEDEESNLDDFDDEDFEDEDEGVTEEEEEE